MLVTLIVFAILILITLINHDRFVTCYDRHSSNQSLIDADSSALHGVSSISPLRLQNTTFAPIIRRDAPTIHHVHFPSPSVIG